MITVEDRLRDAATEVRDLAEGTPLPQLGTVRVQPLRRQVPRWVAAGLATTLVVIAVGGAAWILQGGAPEVADEPALTSIVAPEVTPTTEVSPPSTTLAAPVPTPPQITWERIDSPGAFDLEEPFWSNDLELYAGQSIEAIIAVPPCAGCDGVAMYVAGGHTGIKDTHWDARVWISENGRDWTAIDGPGFADEGSQTIHSLATDGSRIVAAGDSVEKPYFPTSTDRAMVWISDDLGRVWSLVEADALTVDSGRMLDIVWTGSGFIGIGSEFWFSPDGSTWEIATDLSQSMLVSRVIPWNTGWVAVGETVGGFEWEESGIGIWASDDGRSWDLVLAEPDSRAIDVAAGPEGLLAAGPMYVWRSPDGHSWERVLWETDASIYDRDMENLALIGDWVIASGNGSTRTGQWKAFMLASADGGTTWVDVSIGDDLFEADRDEFSALEVMQFPGDASGERLVLAGSHRGNAAIWVGTLER